MAGWHASWIAQLNWERNSWTAPIDTARIPPRGDTGQATARQVSALVGRLQPEAGAPTPLFVFDAGYDPISLTVDCAATPAQLLVRIRDDRVFYTAPPARCPGAAGRPRRHGAPFRCADPATWSVPDATLVTTDPQYGRIEVTTWTGLHPRPSRRRRWSQPGHPPIVSGTVIRVAVEHLPRKAVRAQKMLWLWWAGLAGPRPDLACCWRAYRHRFDIEHKAPLRQDHARLGHPAGPHTRAGRPLGRPGPRRLHPAPTRPRVGRRPATALGAAARPHPTHSRPRPPGFLSTAAGPGAPARAPKPSKAGPGRPKGSRRGPAPRHPAIKKAAQPPCRRLSRKLSPIPVT